MDGQTCDRHPSAAAKARILLPSLGELFFCSHCLKAFEKTYQGEFHVSYPAVTVYNQTPHESVR